MHTGDLDLVCYPGHVRQDWCKSSNQHFKWETWLENPVYICMYVYMYVDMDLRMHVWMRVNVHVMHLTYRLGISSWNKRHTQWNEFSSLDSNGNRV